MKKKVIKPIILIVAFLMLFNMSNIFLNKSYAAGDYTVEEVRNHAKEDNCIECRNLLNDYYKNLGENKKHLWSVPNNGVLDEETIKDNVNNAPALQSLRQHLEEARASEQPGLSEGVSDINDIVNGWNPKNALGNDEKLIQRVSVIASLIRTIGILVSIGTLMLMGIKYMLSSVEERARYKETMIPWTIGAVLVFAMTTIPSLLFEIANGLF